MTPRLPSELQHAVDRRPGEAIALRDDRTETFYVLLPHENYERLLDDYTRRELQKAFEQSTRGEVEAWDIEKILAECRRRQGCENG